MKERYQDIDDKNESLREFFAEHSKAREFLDRFEMSWVYHDNALEGVVYAPPELQAALHPEGPPDASMVPAVLDIRNQKAAMDYIREEAKAAGRKQSAVSMAVLKRIHDLLLGNTPEAQAARAARGPAARSTSPREPSP